MIEGKAISTTTLLDTRLHSADKYIMSDFAKKWLFYHFSVDIPEFNTFRICVRKIGYLWGRSLMNFDPGGSGICPSPKRLEATYSAALWNGPPDGIKRANNICHFKL